MTSEAGRPLPETAAPANESQSSGSKSPGNKKRYQRLGTAAFQIAFKNGRPLRLPLLQMRIWRRADGDSATRVAFVVAKKLGKATFRNRVRRRMREIYRLMSADYRQLAGCDLIFLATPLSAAATPVALADAFRQLVGRAARSAGQMGAGQSGRETSTELHHAAPHDAVPHRVEAGQLTNLTMNAVEHSNKRDRTNKIQ